MPRVPRKPRSLIATPVCHPASRNLVGRRRASPRRLCSRSLRRRLRQAAYVGSGAQLFIFSEMAGVHNITHGHAFVISMEEKPATQKRPGGKVDRQRICSILKKNGVQCYNHCEYRCPADCEHIETVTTKEGSWKRASRCLDLKS